MYKFDFDSISALAASGVIFYVRRCNSWMGVPSDDGHVYVKEHDGYRSHGLVHITDEMVTLLRNNSALEPARK